MKANYCPECGKALRFDRTEYAEDHDMKFYVCWTRRGCAQRFVLEYGMLSYVEAKTLAPSSQEPKI
jgi:hypothetical protein